MAYCGEKNSLRCSLYPKKVKYIARKETGKNQIWKKKILNYFYHSKNLHPDIMELGDWRGEIKFHPYRLRSLIIGYSSEMFSRNYF